MAEYRDPNPITPEHPEYDKSKVDPRVANYTKHVRHSETGLDTREAMARAEEISNITAGEAKEQSLHTQQRQAAVETQFDDVLAGWSDERPVDNAETMAGRTNRDTGENWTSLGERLDEEQKRNASQLAQKANQINELAINKADKSYVDKELTSKPGFSDVRLKSEKIEPEDASDSFLELLNGGQIDLITIPQNKSVDYDKFANNEFVENLVSMRRVLQNMMFETGNNYFDQPLETYANNYWQVNGFTSNNEYSCYVFKLKGGTYTLRGHIRHVWVYDLYPIVPGRETKERLITDPFTGEFTFTVNHDFYLMVNMFNDSSEYVLQQGASTQEITKDHSIVNVLDDNLVDLHLRLQRIASHMDYVPGNNYFETPLKVYKNQYMQIQGLTDSDTYSCYIFKLPKGTYSHLGKVRHLWVYDELPKAGVVPKIRVLDSSYTGTTTFTVEYDFYLMVNMFNDSADYILQEGSQVNAITPDRSKLDEFSGTTNPLAGKTLLNFGDSIAAGNGDRDENGVDIGYSKRIGKRNSMTVYNRAVGGATITPREGTTNDIINQINQAIRDNIDADYIAFNGVTNDTLGDYNIPLGEIESGYNADFDTTTFSGAFQEVCKLLKTNRITAKIIYIRPHNMGGRNDDRQVEFGERALEICRKWSIPYIDMFNEGGLNTKLSQYVGIYTPVGDAVHPNGLGYEMFYVPRIESKMKSI